MYGSLQINCYTNYKGRLIPLRYVQSDLSDRTAIMTAIGLVEGSTDFEVLGAIA
jgi:hypothetical protein